MRLGRKRECVCQPGRAAWPEGDDGPGNIQAEATELGRSRAATRPKSQANASSIIVDFTEESVYFSTRGKRWRGTTTVAGWYADLVASVSNLG